MDIVTSVRSAARRVQTTVVVIRVSLATTCLMDIVTCVRSAVRRVQATVVVIRARLATTGLIVHVSGV